MAPTTEEICNDLPAADEWYRLPTVSRLSSPPVLAFVENGIVWHVGRTGRWVRCWATVYEGKTFAQLKPPPPAPETGRRWRWQEGSPSEVEAALRMAKRKTPRASRSLP